MQSVLNTNVTLSKFKEKNKKKKLLRNTVGAQIIVQLRKCVNINKFCFCFFLWTSLFHDGLEV